MPTKKTEQEQLEAGEEPGVVGPEEEITGVSAGVMFLERVGPLHT